ncbi:MAG: type II toxin-antitoxin system RelE family toxin [Actinomycetota bacterium]
MTSRSRCRQTTPLEGSRLSRPFEVEITPEGLRSINKLPEKIRFAVLEAVLGSIASNPRRAGKPLRGELEGLFSARRGDFRVIYEIDDKAKIILVHRAHHRRDAYRSR